MTRRRSFREFATFLVVVPLAAVIWLVMSRLKEPTREGAEVASVPETPGTPSRETRPDPPRHAQHRALASVRSENQPGDPSHPMSADRLRAYRQNDIIGQIDAAIVARDYEGIRRLNAEYRQEYPDDDQMTREAYDLVADCLEHKTPELVARARRFWETKRGSRARRDLRRICLE